MNLRFWRGDPEKNVSEEKRKLERELALQVKACQELEGQINELDKAYRAAEFRLRQASIENNSMVRQHGDRIKALTLEHSKSISESNERYSSTLASLKQEHNIDLMKRDANHGKEVERLGANYGRQIQNLETNHGRKVEALKSNHNQLVKALETTHSQQVGEMARNHSRQVSQLEKDIRKLVGQLLVNQDGNQGWPDDKLKFQFKQLQRLIESVTSPRNKEFVIPPNQQLGPHLDPTNFLGRVGRGKSHFMLKSVTWTILQEQFFSAPFGFGALGPGKGQRELLDVYLTWRKSFDERAGTASPIDDGFAIFRQDELANNWRSANFRCINVVLTGGGNRDPAPDSPLAKLSTDNVQQTVDRVMGVLSEVSRLSNSNVRSDVEDEIHKMANLAHEIALQFGVHTAQLCLSVPHRGAQIQIGEEFHDCEDGDFHRGTICLVDLVTFPGLERIGDGRSDMSSKQIITPCEIYPGGQHS